MIRDDEGFWSAIDSLIAQSEIAIDRPKGTKHPRFDFIYPVSYGYLKKQYQRMAAESMCGEGVFLRIGVMLLFAQLTC